MPLAILVACAPAVRLVAHAPPRLHAAARAAPPSMQAGGNNGGGGNNLGAAGVATAAAAAIEEISRSVRTEGVAAPETVRSFVAMDRAREGIVDADGLPVIYDRAAIQAYWDKQGGALQQRWVEFLGVTVPFITRVASLLIGGGTDALEENASELARDARINLEKLGPTYVKMGQMMSVRPDILPQAALDELAALQDGVKGFETEIARQVVEEELGRPIDDVFEEFSAEPVAAASLAQVYRAVLKETGEVVAVKVQRPEVQSTVSKDLYVLRRAAEVYQGLVGRFAPQQRTDYVALFNEWAVGFYTELDFKNEGANMDKMRELLDAQGVRDVLTPAVYPQYTSRRVLVTEWVDGVKLSECTPDQVKDLLEVGQEVFLTQLLQVGFFHSDPHPGNLMRPHDQSKGKLALIDFGLVAQVEQEDMDGIISSIVHLANKDYAALVDDFIALKILPADTNRVKVVPLMDKALTPYVKGGGAKRYEQELKSMYGFEETGAVGGFQAMTQDMLTVLNDIPFSIPPYFALIARAVVTLEGLALQSDPDYGLVLEAYPFVARKLLSEDRPEVQRALQQVLYSGGEMNGVVTPTRLAALVNNAAGIVARQEGAAFVDLDAVPSDGISVTDAIAFVLSPQAASLRALLETEAITAADLLLRQALRKSVVAAAAALPQPPTLPFLPAPPNPLTLPAPFVIPPSGGRPARPLIVSTEELVENLAPKLTREEELYAISLTDLVKSTLGPDAAAVVSGELVTSPLSALRLLLAALAAAPAGGDAAAAPAGAAAGPSVPPAVAQAARQLADALPGGGGAALAAADFAASSDGTATMSVDDLAAAVGELGADERAALDESAGRVAEELQRRLNERVEAL